MTIQNRAMMAPLVALVVLCCVFQITVYNRMAAAISSPQRAELFVSKDSRHYLRMAEAMVDGQVVDSITQREHRQPLSIQPCSPSPWRRAPTP